MPTTTPSFVVAGRQPQFERLKTTLAHALAGQPQVVLLTGEAGIGKTFLLREFCSQAQRMNEKVIVAWGQCSSQLGDPYLPFKEILALLTGDVDGAFVGQIVDHTNAQRLKDVAVTATEIIVEVGGDLIGILIPGAALLARVVGILAKTLKIGWISKLKQQVEKPDSLEGFKPEQFYEQISRVVMHLAAKVPLILVLDDLQWGDAATLEMFFYLTRRLQQVSDMPVMLLGAYRPAEIRLGRNGGRHPLERISHEIRRYWQDAELDLTETVGSQTGRAFVDGLVDTEPNRLDAAFRDLLFHRTDGHPLFTVEILRMLEERGVLVKDDQGRWVVSRPLTFEELPDRVEAVIEERIGRLERELKDILTCGSVEGERFTAEIVARVRRIEELHLAEQLTEELEKRHFLIVPAGELQAPQKRLHAYRFMHALFQQYLYGNLSSMQRQQLHRAVGEALEALYGENVGQIAGQLAQHFDEAGEDQKALNYWLVAGDQARAVYANADAVHYFLNAREIIARRLPDHQEQEYLVARSLAQLYSLQGLVGEQQAELERMFRLAESSADKGKIVECYIHRSGFLTHTGDYEGAKQAGDQALKVAQDVKDEPGIVAARVALGEACAFLAEHAEALDYLQGALEFLRNQGDRHKLADAIRLIALVYLNRNDYPEALSRAEEALALFRETGDRLGEDETLRYIGDIYCARGDYQQGLNTYQEVLRIRRDIGNRARQGGALGDIGDVYLYLGDYQKSLDLHQQSLEINLQVGYKYGQTWCHHDLGVIQFNLGNLVAARSELEQALALAGEIQSQNLIVLSKNDLSSVLRALGGQENLVAALQLARDAAAIAENASLVFGQIAGLSYQAMVYLVLDDRSQALQRSRAAVELIESHGASEVLSEEIFYNHAQILDSLGLSDESRTWLKKAHDEITLKADKILDPALRASFLTAVPLNRAINAAWQAARGEASAGSSLPGMP